MVVASRAPAAGDVNYASVVGDHSPRLLDGIALGVRQPTCAAIEQCGEKRLVRCMDLGCAPAIAIPRPLEGHR